MNKREGCENLNCKGNSSHKFRAFHSKMSHSGMWCGVCAKLPFFVAQEADVSKYEVAFCQKSIGAITCSPATLYDIVVGQSC